MNTIAPLISSIVSLLFAIAVFDQYLARRKPYQLVWTLGLLTYFVSTGSEFYIGAVGLSSAAYRLWYLCGAVFSAAYLGMGTVYLLMPRRTANIIMIVLGLASALAIYRVFNAPIDLSQLTPGVPLSGAAFPLGTSGPRLLTPLFNVFGTVALVVGALWSAWVFWRRRLFPHRVLSNVLIALGALLPALGGTFSRLGRPEYLYLSELLGVIVIFVGFLRSREVFGLFRLPFIHGFRRQPE